MRRKPGEKGGVGIFAVEQAEQLRGDSRCRNLGTVKELEYGGVEAEGPEMWDAVVEEKSVRLDDSHPLRMAGGDSPCRIEGRRRHGAFGS